MIIDTTRFRGGDFEYLKEKMDLLSAVDSTLKPGYELSVQREYDMTLVKLHKGEHHYVTAEQLSKLNSSTFHKYQTKCILLRIKPYSGPVQDCRFFKKFGSWDYLDLNLSDGSQVVSANFGDSIVWNIEDFVCVAADDITSVSLPGKSLRVVVSRVFEAMARGLPFMVFSGVGGEVFSTLDFMEEDECQKEQ